MQCYDSLLSRALEEKTNDLDFCKIKANFSITQWQWLIYTDSDAIFLFERVSEKRKCDINNKANRFIAWTNSELIFHDENISSNNDNRYREIKQAEVILLIFYHCDKVNVISSFESNFNSEILTLVSNAINNDNINDNLTLSRKIVNRRTCMIHFITQNHFTSLITSVSCSSILFEHLSASVFNDVIEQTNIFS